jgi:hypothetical protein
MRDWDMARQPHQIYQIKVTLKDTHPPIWRRILVPSNTTLLKLHDILQIVMGWEDYHLHMFKIEGLLYGNPADDEYGELGTSNEASYKLSQVIEHEGQRFAYEYDFGDSWDHTLLLEKILLPQEGVHYPLCLRGRLACPPEDVGGVWGYKNFLEAIRNPDHSDYEMYLNWIGEEFDPEAFDLEEVNTQLRNMGRGRSVESQNTWYLEDDELTGKKFNLDSLWLQDISKENQLIAEELPLRQDMISLLTYLRENKVTGTQSTGNLPLKAVHEICSRFVNPPKLEERVGESVFRVRSESEVWPLYFRHLLASVGGLVMGGLGRRWKLTSLGESFLTVSAPLQVWLLLATWWTQINWAIASPFVYGDGYMPYDFSTLTLKHLLELPLEELTQFEAFADLMIEDARLFWPIEDQNNAHRILQKIIEWTVIGPMVDFGILSTVYQPHQTLGAEFRELSAFQITPFGKRLLEAIDDEMKQEYR